MTSRPKRSRPAKKARPAAPTPPLRPQSHRRGEPEPSYDLLAVLGRVIRDLRAWILPSLARNLKTAAHGATNGLQRAGSAIYTHRQTLSATLTRALWWGALVLLLVVGRDLLAGRADGMWVTSAFEWFCIGLGACVAVTAFSQPRHLRIAGAVLGTGHGAFALLSYLSVSALS